jgi:hypothetical protein
MIRWKVGGNYSVAVGTPSSLIASRTALEARSPAVIFAVLCRRRRECGPEKLSVRADQD